MRVLVTGATGFIGRHVLGPLVKAGAEVHACSRSPQSSERGLTWHRADVLNAADASAIVGRVCPDVLLHLAWFATPPDYWRSPLNLRWTSATLELAHAFVQAGGRRLVGVGTCAEYSWLNGRCVEGVTPIQPTTVYGGCKAAVWSALEPYAREGGVNAAWARLFFVYGPHEPPSRLVPSLVTAIRAGMPARCRAANHVRDFLHVADAGSAIAALALSPVQGAVNIASGEPSTVGAIAEGIARRLDRSDLLQMELGPPEEASVVASVDRLRDEVGWRPAFTLDAGLDDAVAWWSNRSAKGTLPSRTVRL